MSRSPEKPRLRVLILCTGNSARSQIAEAILNHKGASRLVAESAGSSPADRVNPLAIAALQERGYRWSGHGPRGLDPVIGRDWDIVLTVCDNAKEACPILPGAPLMVHWGMPDPAEVTGSESQKRAAFETAARTLERRIDRLLALPLETLDRAELKRQLDAIGA